MPVIAAVNGFCLGGGIGLVGNADVIVASDDATFGLPEVDRGALGAATHLARLVPQHLMRAMVLHLGRTVTAAELHHFGSVLEVVPRDELRRRGPGGRRRDRRQGRPTVIRAAKESLNGIDPATSTAATASSRASPSSSTCPAWPTSTATRSLDEAGHVTGPERQAHDRRGRGRRRDESGMTVGIGGWGSRRKPMALVRAILRTDLPDLTIVSYGGPDVGLLCAAGKVKRLTSRVRLARLDPARAVLPAARQRGGGIEFSEVDEGMLQWGLLAASHRLPFLPIRAGLGSDVLRVNPGLQTVRSPYPRTTARSSSRCRPCASTSRWCT